MIVICHNISREKWKSFFNESSVSTPFQSPEYFDFINSISGLSAEVFAIEESKELLALCVVSYQKAIGGEI